MVARRCAATHGTMALKFFDKQAKQKMNSLRDGVNLKQIVRLLALSVITMLLFSAPEPGG
jgi:hypothetical protein